MSTPELGNSGNTTWPQVREDEASSGPPPTVRGADQAMSMWGAAFTLLHAMPEQVWTILGTMLVMLFAKWLFTPQPQRATGAHTATQEGQSLAKPDQHDAEPTRPSEKKRRLRTKVVQQQPRPRWTTLNQFPSRPLPHRKALVQRRSPRPWSPTSQYRKGSLNSLRQTRIPKHRRTQLEHPPCLLLRLPPQPRRPLRQPLQPRRLVLRKQLQTRPLR